MFHKKRPSEEIKGSSTYASDGSELLLFRKRVSDTVVNQLLNLIRVESQFLQ